MEALGFRPEDVRHIVLTHLDFDHAGGIEDFPHARVHVLREEWQAAQDHRGFIGRRRYRPDQWDAGVQWELYGATGESWHGFPAVRALAGLPPEILLIPLVGHTWGHCGVAIQTPDRWLLHAGDAYFYADEIHGAHYACPPGLRFYQAMMEVDRAKRLENQQHLRNLRRDQGAAIDIICSHDPLEFESHRTGVA